MNTIEKIIAKNLNGRQLCVNYALEYALDDHISSKNVQFLDNYGEEDFFSKVFKSPTYLDLAIFVNDRIMVSGDDHHVFLENLYLIETKNAGTPEEIEIYSYDLGS